MKRDISAIDNGNNARVGEFLVNRLLPAEKLPAVGALVFLDHVYPTRLTPQPPSANGSSAHPHRGIATLSYVLKGNLLHFDSIGNRAVVGAGGLQWMKAGRGIIHEELPLGDEHTMDFESLQFWINLPPLEKKNQPEYLSLYPDQVPILPLPADAGEVRILMGTLGAHSSLVPSFCSSFIYHFRIFPKSSFVWSIETPEIAAFIPSAKVIINGNLVENSKMAIFGSSGTEINLQNPGIGIADVFLFGGLPYTDPIVAQGPFVMNSHQEIATAYRDFFDGKYGTIDYQDSNPQYAPDTQSLSK